MTQPHRYNRYLIFALILLVGTGLALALPYMASSRDKAPLAEDCINKPHAGKRYYVAITGTGTAPELSWSTAFTNVQDALDVAVTPSEIWVAEGVYYPDIGGGQINDSVNATFLITDGVSILGGFNFGDTDITDRDWVNNVTVLSGDIDWDNGGADITDGNGVVITTTNIISDNAHHVVTAVGVTGTAKLDGFTITAGQAVGDDFNENGGGFYCDGHKRGTAQTCNPGLRNITFSGNLAVSGGAMYNWGENGESSPILINVIFSGNSAESSGGAMYNYSEDGESSPILINVAFLGNSASDGGAMANNGVNNGTCRPNLTNVTISGNLASDDGGGIHNRGSGPEVYNSILWNNSAEGITGTIIANIYNASASITLTHSLVEGAYAGGSWIGGDYKDGLGNIDQVPMFITPVDPSDAPTTYGNLRLRVDSPAIDKGNNGDVPEGITTDLDGYERFVDGNTSGTATVDMGAYEYLPKHQLTVNKSGTGDGTVNSTPEGIDCGDTCDVFYTQGSTVALKPVPAAGSIFSGWSGACSGDGDCQLTMDAAKSVTATFDLESPEPAYEINLPLVQR